MKHVLETIIGLEVHAQMNTKSKMFCRCDNDAFGKEPNTLVCPICMGFPGMLPSLNARVVEKSMRTSLALNCQISKLSKFDRKNYFYPDLPKGYQISQFHNPLATNGYLEITNEGEVKKIRINRLHIEDDAGKLTHEGGSSFCDYNRSGTPLMEIVTEPDLRSAVEAKLFAEDLQKLLQYVGSSDADMYKGMMRFDASVSLRPKGEDKLYPRTEIKNLNSFKALESAINFEVKRQTGLWNIGKPQANETTVGWVDELGKTQFMRNKEGASDYRYFPEPDLPPLSFSKESIAEQQAKVPELPQAKERRFKKDYQLKDEDIETLTTSKDLANYFEEVVKESGDIKKALSFILTILLKLLKEDDNKKISKSVVTTKQMVELIALINKGDINANMAKEVLPEMYQNQESAGAVVERKGLKQVSDVRVLASICQEVLANNIQAVEDFKKGKDKAFGALVGQVMAKTRGQANPKIVNDILRKSINA